MWLDMMTFDDLTTELVRPIGQHWKPDDLGQNAANFWWIQGKSFMPLVTSEIDDKLRPKIDMIWWQLDWSDARILKTYHI